MTPRSRAADDPWREEHARTSAYGEEPPPPPMPGEPELPPELFRPPEDPRLELDLSERTRPGNEPPRSGLSAGQRRLFRGLVAVAVVAAVGTLVWQYREPIADAVPEDLDQLGEQVGLGDDESAEPVLLLIDTTPKDAKIFIDGVWTDERPIRVPRSEALVQVRVEAEGYEPRRIRVKPTITRRLEVKLDRKARNKKR